MFHSRCLPTVAITESDMDSGSGPFGDASFLPYILLFITLQD
jgi:hypothetical protein